VQALAGVCLLLFVAVSTWVGVRMLLLARRTRGRPELLIGLGMTLIGAVGFPAGLFSGFGGPVGGLVLPLWLLSTLVNQAGIVAVYLFTQQVFRPREPWAKGIVAAAAAVLLASLVGSLRAFATADPETLSQVAARRWLFIGLIGYSGCFLWGAVEGGMQYAMARRRLALGLADPAVVNRFLLWAVFGVGAAGINAASAIGTLMAADPTRSPSVLVPMGVLGAISCAAMYLAFLPPSWYLGWLRGGARA
jgi:hypothetical protein